MKINKIVFLNGVSSSGKTTISKALQEIADEHFYCLSNDNFNNFYWSMFHNKHDKQIEKLGTENNYFVESIIFMYRLAKIITENGINIIIDGVLEEIEAFTEIYKKSHYELLLDIFAGHNIFMVEVFCPLEECRRRNIARGDRDENQSFEQNKIMNKNIKYNLFLDTSVNNANECAYKILEKIYDL
jgi:adenylylsulfate kinase/chloramphenicol 3-O phosphotransferase